MNILSKLFIGLSLISFNDAVFAQSGIKDLTVLWRPVKGYDGKSNAELDFVLKNTTGKEIRLGKKDLWFNAIYPVVSKQTEEYNILDKNGCLFCIQFNDNLVIKPADSLVIKYNSKYPIVNVSNVPNGLYFQDRDDVSQFYPVTLQTSKVLPENEMHKGYLANLYQKNKERQVAASTNLILPSPKSLQVEKGNLVLSGEITYAIDPSFNTESGNLELFANPFKRVKFVPKKENAQVRIQKGVGYGAEAYSLVIDKNGVAIEASYDAGVFYALQTLRSLLDVSAYGADQVSLPYLKIQDEPRYAYRGYMMDISRNFKSKSVIMKYLDLMARYKLNTFHFHFIDDEGWRIEIPALPELTEIGANRTPLFSEHKGIQPSYGSGAVSTEKHYLSRQDFIEILRYAKQRHITIVPEIETPGHARASIKAMDVRYERYMAKGNKKEAERYLLRDFEDKSTYNSAQHWNDNVMNVALPSVYSFISVVLDEFKSMYAEAGLDLKKVSLGGDEVPNGSWEKSPKIQSLRDSLGMASVWEVWPYYIKKVNAICQEKGLQLAGWEEMGMVNKGKGMDVNQDLSSANIQLDVWNNLVGGGQEDLAYKLANAGYPVVSISANNNYFDMAWDKNFEEPGLNWASYVDLYQSYTFLPEDFFATIHLGVNGAKFKEGHFANKTRLEEQAKPNIIGIKGGLWSETVATEDRLDYMMFPRFFSLAERAWSPRRSYEDEAAFDLNKFNEDYSAFLHKVGESELPKIGATVKYRLPAVGVQETEGKLYANAEYPGFQIYYTTDGSTPTKNSKLYTEPISLAKGTTYIFAVIGEDGRSGLVAVVKQ